MNTVGSQSITTSSLPESSGAELQVQRGAMARPTNFTPTNLTEAMTFAKMIADSDLAPKDFKGKPGNVLIAMQMGAEVGLAPMQAVQNIAVINGRPSLWGDAALAVVQAHAAYEFHNEKMEGAGDNRVAVFQIKRRGQELHETRFSVADARKALLWGKQGPWTQYPDRMQQMRARSFGLRDKFSDALRGLITAEEAMDIPPDEMPVRNVERPAEAVEVLKMPTRKLAENATETQAQAAEVQQAAELKQEPKPSCPDCGESERFTPTHCGYCQWTPELAAESSSELSCSGAPDCPCKRCTDSRVTRAFGNSQQESGEVVTSDQSRRFFAKFTAAGRTKTEVRAYLQANYGITDDRKMLKKDYDAICRWVEERR